MPIVTTGLQLYYNNLNPANTATVADDLSPNGRNGTISGTVNNLSNGWSFDGVDDVITTTYNPNINRAAFTYEVWFRRPNTDATVATLLSTATGTQFISAVNAAFNITVSNVASNVTGTRYVADAVVHLVVASADRNNIQVYVNNANVLNFTANNDGTFAGNVQIGRRGGATTTPFLGDIFAVRLYNRQLSSAEVTQNFNMGSKDTFTPIHAGSGTIDAKAAVSVTGPRQVARPSVQLNGVATVTAEPDQVIDGHVTRSASGSANANVTVTADATQIAGIKAVVKDGLLSYYHSFRAFNVAATSWGSINPGATQGKTFTLQNGAGTIVDPEGTGLTWWNSQSTHRTNAITNPLNNIQNCTIEFWARADGGAGQDVSNGNNLIGFFQSPNTTGSGEIKVINGGAIRITTQSSGNFPQTVAKPFATSTQAPLVSPMRHVVIIQQPNADASNHKFHIYIDGSFLETLNLDSGLHTYLTANKNTFALSNDPQGFSGWKGVLDGVKLYNRVLTANEIKQNFAVGADQIGLTTGISQSGLIGYLNSKQGKSGATWQNLAPTGGSNASFRGGAGTTTDPQGSGLMYWDGVDDDAQIPTTPIHTTSHTVEFWLRPDRAGNSQILASGGASIETLTGTGSAPLIYYDAISSGHETTQSLTFNQLYHVVFTRATDVHKWYVNGALDSSFTSTTAGFEDLTDTTPFNLAYAVLVNFQGVLDSIKVYDRTISEEEITQNFIFGTGVGLADELPPTTPVIHSVSGTADAVATVTGDATIVSQQTIHLVSGQMDSASAVSVSVSQVHKVSGQIAGSTFSVPQNLKTVYNANGNAGAISTVTGDASIVAGAFVHLVSGQSDAVSSVAGNVVQVQTSGAVNSILVTAVTVTEPTRIQRTNGTADSISAATGNTTVLYKVTATADSIATITVNAVRVQRVIASQSDAVSVASAPANLTQIVRVSGQTDGISAVTTGNVNRIQRPSGTADSISSISGNATEFQTASGTIGVVSTVDGVATQTTNGIVNNVSGTIDAVSSVTTATIKVLVSGIVNPQIVANVTTTPNKVQRPNGSADLLATVSANTASVLRVLGNIAATVDVVGTIGGVIPVAGSANIVAAVTGNTRSLFAPPASSDGVTAVTGTANRASTATATVAGITDVTALTKSIYNVSGSIQSFVRVTDTTNNTIVTGSGGRGISISIA